VVRGKKYCDKIRTILEANFPDYKIISLINEIPEDTGSGANVQSATGNHINFLLCEDVLYFPDYCLETDDEAYDILNNNLNGTEVVRVISKYLMRISKVGGVLNCITWQA